jgi:regulator of protease activity HflC (stomatin/prohibitin superfamily)
MAQRNPSIRNGVQIGVAVAFFLILISSGGCMTTSIGSGGLGVKFNPLSGGTDLDKVYGEGLNIHAPWVEVIQYDVRVQEQLEQLNALSSNGLTIGMEISIRWRPDADSLPNLHQTYGTDYAEKLVLPELRSAVREVVGQFTPEELYSTRRNELQTNVLERVASAVESRYVDVEAVLIRDVSLPQQIRSAIENKLEEEQRVEQARLSIQRAEQEANRKRVEAQGDADRARIIAESLSPGFLKFQGIQATLELAKSPNAKTVIIGAGGDGLPVILGDQ